MPKRKSWLRDKTSKGESFTGCPNCFTCCPYYSFFAKRAELSLHNSSLGAVVFPAAASH